LGRKISKVEKLFVNGDGGPEKYVAMKMGLIWRKKTALLPVESRSETEDGGESTWVTC
jgi:hypothetical protein